MTGSQQRQPPRRKPADWQTVQAARYRAGLVDEGGNSRRVRANVCERCRGPILTALDGDVLAFTARVDPAPVDTQGELVAVLTGRLTYRLAWRGGRYELDPRGAPEISRTSPDSVEVVVEHRCGQPIPSARRAPQAARSRAKAAEPLPEHPPF